MAKNRSKTRYMSDYYLSVLARPAMAPSGRQGREIQVIHGTDICGIAVYVSALDAEIARAHRIANGQKNWRRFGLDELDVLGAMAGVDAMKMCVVFGFGATEDGRLQVEERRLQPVHFPLNFAGLGGSNEPITLNFESKLFEGMREQWASIGAANYGDQVTRLNRLTPLRLAHMANAALRAGAPSDNDEYGHAWGVYQPESLGWQFGAANKYVVATQALDETGSSSRLPSHNP